MSLEKMERNSTNNVEEDFEQRCVAYYATIGGLKAKRARGEVLSWAENLLLSRAEVRNV